VRSFEKFVPHWLPTGTRLLFFSFFDVKDIVAVAAGFMDGLGWGFNTKGLSRPSSTPFRWQRLKFSPPLAAIMRIGMEEVKDFCLEYFPSTQERTFLEESCGIADIITSCELSSTCSLPVPHEARPLHPFPNPIL
jgi:NAD-dependent glycerol-3-phosphate dehydrogenase C-terminus